MELQNKTVVITGGGRGLGAAMATRLAAQGCNLALVDLDQEALARTLERCNALGPGTHRSYHVNVCDEAAVETLFDQVIADFGGLHALVNNAGITRDALTLKYKDGKQVGKLSLEQWRLVLDVNLTGVFLCGREAAARMIENDCRGCIINISSISRAGNMGQLNYSASKSGVQSMTVVWAKEFARYGIRCAAIAPGFVATEMVMAMKSQIRDKLTTAIPLGRLGEPDEIASTVQFILENDYVSGRCFEVDGALRM